MNMVKTLVEKLLVKYLSGYWTELVEQGWLTLSVDENDVATMVRE
jgi:hypothetical protein